MDFQFCLMMLQGNYIAITVWHCFKYFEYVNRYETFDKSVARDYHFPVINFSYD